jgi:hypothetical protein
VLVKLNIYVQKNEIGSSSHITYKINSKWTNDQNLRSEFMKLLEHIMGKRLHEIGLSNDFWDYNSKARDHKSKNK